MSSVYEDSICSATFKKYDSILNDKSENFETKVSSLIEVWTSISELNLSQFDIRYVIQIIDWAKLHALNIVLTGEWRSTKESFRNSLLESIEKAQNSLATVNDAFSSRCQKLADVVKKPWEDPVLANLIQEKDVEIGSKEIEFFCVETAYLVSVRLKKLCENHCEDLALNLITNFLNYKKLAAVKNFNLNATETQLWFIFDIYIALLYKFQDKAKILEQFEELPVEEGVLLIKRFAKKRVKISKIWRNCHKIAIFGSRFFMSRALMKYTDDYKDFVTDLLKTYLALSNTDSLLQEFVLSVRNITNLADAAGLCVMCEVIHREAADKLRVFAIEMYIRALTTDMNELERLKHVNEDDKVKSTTSRLSRTFTNLADLLDDHVKVARECVLTAFSLEPTKDRLKRIEDLAKRSGFPVLDTGQEWKCTLHPPVLPSDDLAWVCPECGEWMCKPELTAPLQMNMALHEALQESVLGISEALCDDLVVCLSNPRYQILSWLLAWGDLYRLCILYLNDPEKTKNFVTELKFVDVDYSMFEHIKREPVDEYTGIEKGYEQYLDLDFVSDEETSSVSEDSMSHDRSVGLGSDGAGEPYLPLPQPKSDPVTLKSLRMFRPNLKRKKEDSDSPTVDKKAAIQVDDTVSATSSTSSLGSYLSSSQYNPQSEYSINIPATTRKHTTPNILKKTPPSSVYLPQAAGVTKQSTTSNLSQGSAASNFSAFGYSSTYAAKSFEVPNPPVSLSRSNFDQVNSRIKTSFNSNVIPVCYPAKLPEARKTPNVSLSASTILQPENSVFNTTNLSSASSTSYVSNIIKSNLSYGVPKVTVAGSTYVSPSSNETITSSHSFGPLTVTKQGLFSTPKQVSFSNSNHTSQKNTSSHESSFAAPSSSPQSTVTPHTLTFQKNPPPQVTTSAVPDLDALLNEIDTNKFETDSKNGVAATLLQLGGQVAKNQKESIQVPEQSNLNQIQTKLPQETYLPNGTTGGFKTRLKNNNKPDKPDLPGEVWDQMMEVSCTQPKINLAGKTTFKIMELQVQIPKLNLEKYNNQDKVNTGGMILNKSTIKPFRIPATLPNCPLQPITPSKIHCPPEICQPEIKTSAPLTQPKPLLFSKPEPSTLLRDKSPSPTEAPAVQAPHQSKAAAAAAKQESPKLTCLKEQCSTPQEPLPQKAIVCSAVQPRPVPEPQLQVQLNREPRPAPRRLKSVIIIPPEKSKKIISQALLRRRQGNNRSVHKRVSKLLSASISLVKKQGFLRTTNTSRSLLKAGVNRPFKVSRPLTDKKLARQKKVPTTCTLADSLKTTTPTTMDCDRDRNVQIDNQKTDIETTEAEDGTVSTAEDNNNHFGSQDSLEKTDEQVSLIRASIAAFNRNQKATKPNLIKQVEVSDTQNINDSIIDSDLASDNIRIENEINTENSGDNPEKTQCNSNNKNDIISSIRNIEKTVDKTLNKDDLAKNGIKKVDIVNKNLVCDKMEACVVQMNNETKKSASRESEPDEQRLQKAKCNTKDEKVTDKNCNDVKTETDSTHISGDKLKNGKITENNDTDTDTLKIIEVDKVTKACEDKIVDSNSDSDLKVLEPCDEHIKIENEDIKTENEDIKTENEYIKTENEDIKTENEDIKTEYDQIKTENVPISSTYKRDDIAPAQELEEAPIDSMDFKIPIPNIILYDENIEDIDTTIEINTIPTVSEIKENIFQSLCSQEVIRTKTIGRKRSHKNKYKEDVRIKIGTKEPFHYIKYIHNYCGGPMLPPRNSKREVSTRPQLNVSHKKSAEVKGSNVLASMSPSNVKETVEPDVSSKMKDRYLLFTDITSESYSDLNKENIIMSSDDNISNFYSSGELDNEDVTASHDRQMVTPTDDVNFDSRFGKSIRGFFDKSTAKNNNQSVKKYTNTHKRKHDNVPCFKVDQEKSTYNKSHKSGTDNFEAKELSVMLKRLPPSMTKRVHKTLVSDSIIFLQQKIRDKIKENVDATPGDLYKKDKQISPLLDFNVRNQVKKKRAKKHKPDYIRNTMKNGGILKNNRNFPKGGILKKKSDFPSKKPKKEKHVRFDLTPQIFAIESVTKLLEEEKKLAQSMIEAQEMFNNVPGLLDFSEVMPRNTEQVVNVVQVPESRSSTVTNQNTQTSTQVSPHIQRIGQPKQSEQRSDRLEEKPDQSPSSSATTSRDSFKPTPALINLFSGQIKPGQKCSGTSRQTPYINILSQQILKHPGKPVSSHKGVNHTKRECPDFSNNPENATVKVEPAENADGQASKSISTNVKIVTSSSQACGAAATATSAQGGTILQFICKSSSLPKFQQAFGKTIYQANSSSEGATETAVAPTSENLNQTTTVVDTKKIATKAVPVNVQPLTGNVIFRGQVPVGQTVSLIPPGSNTRQLFRITGSTHEQISLVKETVIQNKMSALLAAALQGKPKITEQNGELVEEYSATRITLCRPGTVPPNATRIVKPVQLQIPANVIRAPQPNLSSTTLEQLREFDMVYKQVKERSSNPAQPETVAHSSQELPQQQRISFTYVNQVQKYTQLSPVVVVSSYSPIQQTLSPALTVTSQGGVGACLTQVSTVAVPKLAIKTSKGKNIKSSATKTSPTAAVPAIPKPQQKPQEDEHTTQRIFDILAEYAEQLRNSPDLNNKPAPRRRSNPPTNPTSSSSGSSSGKKKKKKSSSSSTTSNLVETDNEDLTMGSEDSSSGNIVQLSMTDEEQSQSASITPPETNLEPATSNTPTPRPLIVADTSNQPRNVIIADSSVGEALKMPNTALIMPGSYIMPVSVVKGGQQIAVVSGGSKILTTVPARSGQNMLLFQSFVNQHKKGSISAVKYSTIQPFSGISSQNLAVSAQPPVLLPSNSVATVALGQPITLKKLDNNERGTNTELLLTISQPREAIKVEQAPEIPQPDSSTSLGSVAIEVKTEDVSQSESSSNEVFSNLQKANSIATSVIASVVKKELEERSENSTAIDTSIVKVEVPTKQVERIGSVLVNASTSNGPMLSHTHPRYRKPPVNVNVGPTTAPTKEFNHNVSKAHQTGTKIFKNNAVYYAIRTKKAIGKKTDSEMQKQAAMEREMRLQKSLSEECEDLGVDEPSTSDLFPEADLLFDSNHSPSYDQTGQRILIGKAKASMHLFSDDENSGPMRTDLFDYVEYHPAEAGVDQINGNNVSNESASSCDDTTLLPKCGTMSEVTLNSPISPEYTDNTHAIHKYKYKYTNRKKGEKAIRSQSENWSEVSSTEGTIDTIKEEEPPIQEGTVTEVETMMEDKVSSENELTLKCPVHGFTDTRSSRKNIKKPCSCFNGCRSATPSHAKRRISSPKAQNPTPSKKPLVSKKR